MNSPEIKIVSLMASNADFFYGKLADYLTCRTGISVSAVDDIDWRDRNELLDQGIAQIGFICGLQYVQKVDVENSELELFVAPVMGAARYEGKPIYFSEVVVRKDSPIQSLAELRGRAWAYNEPTSHSGCNLLRYHLSMLGHGASYFGSFIESGSHQASLQLIMEGEIDAAAIDSTVLELELSLRPEIAQEIRVIETLGPSPMPPAVISNRVPVEIRQAICDALLIMHKDGEGAGILSETAAARFVKVRDGDYDAIRWMAQKTEEAMAIDSDSWGRRSGISHAKRDAGLGLVPIGSRK
jgi:phosphonate transport system substrate-binding protein